MDDYDPSINQFTATYKVPGGKLVRVRADFDGTRLARLQLSGDFFLMPPEKLVDVEKFLLGWDVSVANNADQLASRLDKFLQREQIVLSGVDAKAVGHVIDLLRRQAGIEPIAVMGWRA